MHPRLVVHEAAFPASMQIDAILDWAKANEIPGVGLFSLRRTDGDWTPAIVAAQKHSAAISYVCHASMFRLDDPSTWAASTRAIADTIDAAVAVGAGIVYATTGPAGALSFEAAADALGEAIRPTTEYARSKSIAFLTETTNPLFGFTHFLHTFEDTVEIANRVGVGVCLDLYPTWQERAIRAKIQAAVGTIKMVQVSDHTPRNLSVARDIVGAGVVPIEDLLGVLFEAGFDGPVDLELFGRPDETALDDILLSAARLTEILRRLDV